MSMGENVMIKKKSRLHLILFVTVFCLSFVAMISSFGMITKAATVTDDSNCIEMTKSLTKATYDYLNEIYIKKYPELGTGFLYGSPSDKKILKQLAETIVKECKTDKEKANEIAHWVDGNIDYKSYKDGTYYYPIDVFRYRMGNCLGSAELMVHLLRESGIPAVMCTGSRGDMEKVVKLGNRIELDCGHAWVMAYVEDDWYVYDINFGVYGSNNKDFISKWYFTENIDGVQPYYEGMAWQYVYEGAGIYYINGKFMFYTGGIPASEYYGSPADWMESINMSIACMSTCKYIDENGISDGFRYIENPERRDSMINDECYSDGWCKYGEDMYYFKPNGIIASNQFMKYDGKTYFLAFDGSAIEVISDSEEYYTYCGYPIICEGDNIEFRPVWYDKIDSGSTVEWINYSTDVVDVDQNGKIKIKRDGRVTLQVREHGAFMPEGSWGMASYIQLNVKSKIQQVSFEDMRSINDVCTHENVYFETTVASQKKNGARKFICSDCGELVKSQVIPKIKSIKLSKTAYTYDGKVKKPKVIVIDSKGETLPSTCYKVTYEKGRKKVGFYIVSVKLKGDYTGSKLLSFMIVKRK